MLISGLVLVRNGCLGLLVIASDGGLSGMRGFDLGNAYWVIQRDLRHWA
jgi:hypothetical protein